MKKIICLMVFLLVVLSCASARRAEDFSAADAYDWLLAKGGNGSYSDNVVDTSAAFLAIDAAGGAASSEISYLISQENDNKCWPKTSCKIKDTVWAVMAMQKAGESSYVTEAEAWLRKAQTPALTAGNWWLEIDTPNSGTCTVKYTKGATEVSKTIKVEAGTFPECKGGTFFDLETCLESGLLNTFASLGLHVDCSSLNSAKISIAYNSGSSYYLYQEVSETTADLIVKNGCFGAGYKEASCNYESSLYSDWVLGQVGSTLSSELYLRENYDLKNSFHNALLYMITKDGVYLEQLKKLQKADGSWDSNSLYTAFAILALKSEGEGAGLVEKAQEWLKTKQSEDGSWDGNVFNTAMVIYSSFYQGVELPSCTDGVKNQGERGVDCGGPCEKEPYNDKCCDNGVKDEGEEGIDCGGPCEKEPYNDKCCDNGVKDESEEGIDCGGACDICLEAVCDKDGSCESERGEDCDNCPDDCSSCESLCIDGVVSAASVEEGIDCGGLCLSLYSKECTGVCNKDGKCEIDLVDKGYSSNEDSKNCPDDCRCGDEICDDYERESGTCEEDCPITALEAQCGDGVCSEGEDVSCSEDCVEEVCNNNGVCDADLNEGCSCSDCAEESVCTGKAKSNLKWIIIILLIVVF
ncbi:MAG: hypothetical protein Q8N77_04400, partial [Nanoarchaeota archaeon]|nr:hypothetical protein [Nanoarchaeota archaeon]